MSKMFDPFDLARRIHDVYYATLPLWAHMLQDNHRHLDTLSIHHSRKPCIFVQKGNRCGSSMGTNLSILEVSNAYLLRCRSSCDPHVQLEFFEV